MRWPGCAALFEATILKQVSRTVLCTQITWESCYNADSDSLGLGGALTAGISEQLHSLQMVLGGTRLWLERLSRPGHC